MRWVLAVGLAVGVAGCVRLNPAFGDDAGTETGGMSGESTDDGGSSSTGPVAEYVCGGDQININVMPPPLECFASGGGNVLPVNIDGMCMAVRSNNGRLVVTPATGCIDGKCDVLPGADETVLSAEDTNLGEAIEVGSSPQCRFISAYGFPINEDEDGRCWWDALAVWSTDGELEIAVGNGLPDEGFPGLLARPGHPGVWISSTIIAPSTCGDPLDDCLREGWRAFEFGEMEAPALPDGIPVNSTWDGQEWVVVNQGLQFDRSCDRFGRWGVVRKGYEDLLE